MSAIIALADKIIFDITSCIYGSGIKTMQKTTDIHTGNFIAKELRTILPISK